MERVRGGGRTYIKARHAGRSRSTQVFQKTGQTATLPDLTPYTPCSVVFVSDNQVILAPLGPERYKPIPSQQDFTAFLDSWGGTWMWESIKIMGSWDDIVKEVAAGEAVWVGDGSYNRKIAPETSGGGWIIYCPSSKASIRGNFYEILDDAGSYRAELLTLAALHILALAFMLHYTLPGSLGHLWCDNERALVKSKFYRRRIPPSSKHADILRVLPWDPSLATITCTGMVTRRNSGIGSHSKRS